MCLQFRSNLWSPTGRSVETCTNAEVGRIGESRTTSSTSFRTPLQERNFHSGLVM